METDIDTDIVMRYDSLKKKDTHMAMTDGKNKYKYIFFYRGI